MHYSIYFRKILLATKPFWLSDLEHSTAEPPNPFEFEPGFELHFESTAFREQNAAERIPGVCGLGW
ncbi:hypothetical protein [Saccharibacillus sacchari]|uniref:Uncharacterized protein n=1 Tax=Saccharibacillus sacchari TaxID=456493 RepID=A0ACC6PD70_9BACL